MEAPKFMKNQKKKRSWRCTDAIYQSISEAATQEGMPIAVWIEFAVRAQLKNGVDGSSPVDLDSVGELAKANAMDKLIVQMEKTDKIFEETRKELGISFE